MQILLYLKTFLGRKSIFGYILHYMLQQNASFSASTVRLVNVYVCVTGDCCTLGRGCCNNGAKTSERNKFKDNRVILEKRFNVLEHCALKMVHAVDFGDLTQQWKKQKGTFSLKMWTFRVLFR